MALLSLLTGGGPQRTKFLGGASGPDLMVVDATLSLAPEYESEPTEHPVEEGADITDHVRVKNVRLKMEGIASESPINLSSSLAGLATSVTGAIGAKLGGALGNAVGAAAGGVGGALLASVLKDPEGPKTLPADVREFLIGLLESRKTFTLWTPERRYDDLILTSVVFPKDKTTGRALKFSAQMRQIRIVRSQTVRLDNVSPSVLHTAAKVGKLGRKAASATNSEKGKRASSLVKLGKVTGVFK